MEKLLELEKKLKEYRESLDKMVNQVYAAKAEKHPDEKEDKEMIAEAIDEHNEKKHGEKKDEDSAFKAEAIDIAKNGQWSLDKANKYGAQQEAKRANIVNQARQPATVIEGGATKVISPDAQIKIKADKASDNKAKAEAEAKARRASLRESGELK